MTEPDIDTSKPRTIRIRRSEGIESQFMECSRTACRVTCHQMVKQPVHYSEGNPDPIHRRCYMLKSFTCLVVLFNLIQPSSASSEIVFSVVNNTFSDKQHNILRDLLEGSIMLQHDEKLND